MTLSVGTGGDYDARQLAAAMADEEGDEADEESDDGERDSADANLTQPLARASTAAASQERSPAACIVPPRASTPVARTANSRPTGVATGRKQIGSAITKLAEAIAVPQEDTMGKLMSMMMLQMLNKMMTREERDEERKRRRRERHRNNKRRRLSNYGEMGDVCSSMTTNSFSDDETSDSSED